MLINSKQPEAIGLSLGFYSTLGQVVLLREALTISGGNELTIALALSVWLAGVGGGALAATRIKRPSIHLAAAPFTVFAIFAAELFVLRMHHLFVSIPIGSEPSLVQLTLLLIAGVGIGAATMGFLFTVSSRALAQDSTSVTGRIYLAEAVGALIAGALFTFFMAGRVSHAQTIGVAAAALAPACATLFGRRTRILYLAWFIILVAAILMGPLATVDRVFMNMAFQSNGIKGVPIGFKESHYGRLSLGVREGQYQLFVDGRLDHVFPDPWKNTLSIHAALAQHPNPKNVLLLGGVAPDQLAAALEHNLDSVTLTYLDEDAFSLCEPFFDKETRAALEDPRVHLISGDGRKLIAKSENLFDVIIVFANPPISARDNRYQTVEFFELLHKALTPKGSITIRAPGGANLMSLEASRSAAMTWRTVGTLFKHVVLASGIETIFHASSVQGVVTDKLNELAKRLNNRNIPKSLSVFSRIEETYNPTRITTAFSQLKKWESKAVPINSDLKPYSYLINLQLWERELSFDPSESSVWSGVLEKSAWLWPVVFFIIWLTLMLIKREPKRAKSNAIFSMATTGAAGMSMEIATLYMYQASCGVLYVDLAFLVSMFMLGLTVGSTAGKKLFGAWTQKNGAVSDLFVLILLLATGPILSRVFEYSWIAFLWSAAAGVATGAAFMIVLTELEKQSKEARTAAGFIEAADYFGASAGVLITGVVWLPVLGLYYTCGLFAIFKGLSIIGRIISPIYQKN